MRIYAYELTRVNRRKRNFSTRKVLNNFTFVFVLYMHLSTFFVILRANFKALPIYIKFVGAYLFV